jgi:hypothetical protein
MIDLEGFDTFGDVAAEDDAVLEYFLSTNAVKRVESNSAFLVLGRKGTGKTAIVRYLTEKAAGRLSKPLNLRGYPWNVHATRVDRGASEIEAYVASWRYLIAVQFASLALSHKNSSRSIYHRPLRKFLDANYGTDVPELFNILRPKNLTLAGFTISPSILGNQLGGVDLERKEGDYQFGLELNALSSSILTAVHDVIREAKSGPLTLHFDELDQGLTQLDEGRARMLIGLVIASREIKRESERAGVPLVPIVYLRTDLWDELQFSDKNKITQTLTFHLAWTPQTLLELIEARLVVKLGEDASWEGIIEPELMRGSQTKLNHIFARTFLRPRDVISFLNIVLKEAKKRGKDCLFSNRDIVAARDEYSSYLKAELDDEIRPHWPNWDEALQACSALSTLTFERQDFEREYRKRKSSKNLVEAEEALSTLYKFSVVGYDRRSGYGGSSWAFQYTDPEAGWDNGASRFKVHLGLKEYAKLREERT